MQAVQRSSLTGVRYSAGSNGYRIPLAGVLCCGPSPSTVHTRLREADGVVVKRKKISFVDISSVGP